MSAYPEGDPTDTGELLPIRLGESSSVLVIAPEGATTVRAVRGDSVVDSGTVRDAATILDAPAHAGLAFQALDAAGQVLVSGRLTAPDQAVSVQRFDWWPVGGQRSRTSSVAMESAKVLRS